MLDTRNLGDGAVCFVARRNCSISPKGLIGFFAGIAAVSIVISLVFYALGAWMILPFAGLEILALGMAFVGYARHAVDCERISVGHDRIRVEVCDGDIVSAREFDQGLTRLVVTRAPMRTSLALRVQGQEIEIGKHLALEERQQLASALEQLLGRAA